MREKKSRIGCEAHSAVQVVWTLSADQAGCKSVFWGRSTRVRIGSATTLIIDITN